MSLDISISIKGVDKIQEKLGVRSFLGAVSHGMERASNFAVSKIQRERLTKRGPHSLGIQSGDLRKSLKTAPNDPKISGETVTVSIGSNVKDKSGVSYPAIHEFGWFGFRKRAWLSLGVNDSIPTFTKEIEKSLEKALE